MEGNKSLPVGTIGYATLDPVKIVVSKLKYFFMIFLNYIRYSY